MKIQFSLALIVTLTTLNSVNAYLHHAHTPWFHARSVGSISTRRSRQFRLEQQAKVRDHVSLERKNATEDQIMLDEAKFLESLEEETAAMEDIVQQSFATPVRGEEAHLVAEFLGKDLQSQIAEQEAARETKMSLLSSKSMSVAEAHLGQLAEQAKQTSAKYAAEIDELQHSKKSLHPLTGVHGPTQAYAVLGVVLVGGLLVQADPQALASLKEDLSVLLQQLDMELSAFLKLDASGMASEVLRQLGEVKESLLNLPALIGMDMEAIMEWIVTQANQMKENLQAAASNIDLSAIQAVNIGEVLDKAIAQLNQMKEELANLPAFSALDMDAMKEAFVAQSNQVKENLQAASMDLRGMADGALFQANQMKENLLAMPAISGLSDIESMKESFMSQVNQVKESVSSNIDLSGLSTIDLRGMADGAVLQMNSMKEDLLATPALARLSDIEGMKESFTTQINLVQEKINNDVSAVVSGVDVAEMKEQVLEQAGRIKEGLLSNPAFSTLDLESMKESMASQFDLVQENVGGLFDLVREKIGEDLSVVSSLDVSGMTNQALDQANQVKEDLLSAPAFSLNVQGMKESFISWVNHAQQSFKLASDYVLPAVPGMADNALEQVGQLKEGITDSVLDQVDQMKSIELPAMVLPTAPDLGIEGMKESIIGQISQAQQNLELAGDNFVLPALPEVDIRGMADNALEQVGQLKEGMTDSVLDQVNQVKSIELPVMPTIPDLKIDGMKESFIGQVNQAQQGFKLASDFAVPAIPGMTDNALEQVGQLKEGISDSVLDHVNQVTEAIKIPAAVDMPAFPDLDMSGVKDSIASQVNQAVDVGGVMESLKTLTVSLPEVPSITQVAEQVSQVQQSPGHAAASGNSLMDLMPNYSEYH